MRAQRLAYMLFMGTLACGAGPLEPGVGDDPGSGSSTLRVNAEVTATGRIVNAREGTDFDTSIHVRIEKNGQLVTTGTVTMRSSGGDVPLIFDSGDEGGRWRGSQSGYFEVYELEVDAGDDDVSGVRVDGPALHYFTAPLPGATIDATMPLLVTWASDEEAQTATIKTKEIDELTITDSGSFTLPVGAIKSKPEETENEELRLRRSARITPAGAVVGSELRVVVSNRIEVLVAATGL
jgi:hypothetical protein